MKTKEIRELSEQEILQRIEDDERELGQLTFQHAISGLENPLILRTIRREIARLKTLLKEKQTEASEA
ncbi:MAG: 50S ribosomal protein L29 [Rubricoccaceae bacterium]|nr:50S ribosomal protein L29 [Rubricoccaceae bacterium]